MPTTMWTQQVIQHYIDGEREESHLLEYKAADALAKTHAKKSEITKDVSAMANAAGGLILYGVKEYDDQPHLPETLDPVDRMVFPKEWLEHIINNIKPHIESLIIHPVDLDTGPDHTAYVVESPQS